MRSDIVAAIAVAIWESDPDMTAPSDAIGRAESILSALASAGMMVVPGWQDIETAPRDGSRVYAKGRDFGNPEGDEHFCWVVWERGEWLDADDENTTCMYLTHYLPLPTAMLAASPLQNGEVG
jgi:hypothetical protein